MWWSTSAPLFLKSFHKVSERKGVGRPIESLLKFAPTCHKTMYGLEQVADVEFSWIPFSWSISYTCRDSHSHEHYPNHQGTKDIEALGLQSRCGGVAGRAWSGWITSADGHLSGCQVLTIRIWISSNHISTWFISMHLPLLVTWGLDLYYTTQFTFQNPLQGAPSSYMHVHAHTCTYIHVPNTLVKASGAVHGNKT